VRGRVIYTQQLDVLEMATTIALSSRRKTRTTHDVIPGAEPRPDSNGLLPRFAQTIGDASPSQIGHARPSSFALQYQQH
jgi:hypothetical protein